ncbi:MAG: GIY-YIG nuclease family protein [Candidatus Marinimicrobia bacterium]|nr:GIY-YIG nuclease family protein [Candidatus Neomarinimicrobiota bacterium]
MKFVYTIQSTENQEQYYTGLTKDIEHRLADHNSGKSPYTSKYRPWKIISYTAFEDDEKAQAFEKYLKSGSGRAFSKKHLR